MKLAVTTDNGMIFQHFGKSKEFTFYEVEGGAVLSQTALAAPAEGHGALAGFLKEQKADALICGGIGGGAKSALEQAGIALYAGAQGSADDAVKAYLAGSLVPNNEATCNHHHSGEHTCGSHTCK